MFASSRVVHAAPPVHGCDIVCSAAARVALLARYGAVAILASPYLGVGEQNLIDHRAQMLNVNYVKPRQVYRPITNAWAAEYCSANHRQNWAVNGYEVALME